MSTVVKKSISLPRELARETEEIARAQGRSVSAVVQDALREARKNRLANELRSLQGYWSQKAREKGLLSEDDLERYLGE